MAVADPGNESRSGAGERRPVTVPAASRSARWFWGILLGGTLLVGWLHLVGLQERLPFRMPIIDSYEYCAEAQLLLDKRHIHNQPFFHSPLYSYFLALVFAVTRSQLLVPKFLQLGCHLLTVALVYQLAAGLFNRPTARLAAVLFALYGPVVFHGLEISNVAFHLLFIVLTLVLCQRYLRAATWPNVWWLGASLGLGAVNRPDGLPFVVLFLVGLVLKARRDKSFTAGTVWRVAALALLTALPLLGVGVRNRLVAGAFIPLPANGGLGFYLGNNPDYARTIGMRPGDEWDRIAALPHEVGLSRFADPAAFGRYFYQRAFAFITAHPGQWLRALVYKCRTLVNGYELPESLDVYAYRAYSPVLAALVWRVGAFCFPFGALTAVAGPAVVSWRKQAGRLWVLYTWLIASAVPLLGYWNSARYRLLILPVLIVLAAAFLAAYREFGRRRKIAYAVAVVGCGLAFNWPYPHFSQTYNYRAEMLSFAGLNEARGGNHTEARRLFELSLAAEPANARTLYNLAVSEEASGQRELAAVRYRRCLELDGRYCTPHNALGVLRLNEGQPAESLEHFDRAIACDPRASDSYRNKGIASVRLGDGRAAEENFRAALRLNGDDAAAHVELGHVLAARGAVDEAGDHYATAIWINPNVPGPQRALGFLWLEQGRLDQAEPVLARAWELDPRDFLTCVTLGNVYLAQRKLADARRLFESARILKPDEAGVYSNLGTITAMEGDQAGAIRLWEQALTLDPRNEVARENLRRIWSR